MTFSIKDFLSKCDQIRSFLWIWPNFWKKSLMENFIICAEMFILSSNFKTSLFPFFAIIEWRSLAKKV